MLRFMLGVSLSLLIVLTGIGLVLAHPWGWSEYTSDTLYVVYAQMTDGVPSPFFLSSIDGSHQQWQLMAQVGTLKTVSCSPDGRTLAYLTESGHLHVVNRAGEVYDRKLGPGYDTVA